MTKYNGELHQLLTKRLLERNYNPVFTYSGINENSLNILAEVMSVVEYLYGGEAKNDIRLTLMLSLNEVNDITKLWKKYWVEGENAFHGHGKQQIQNKAQELLNEIAKYPNCESIWLAFPRINKCYSKSGYTAMNDDVIRVMNDCIQSHLPTNAM